MSENFSEEKIYPSPGEAILVIFITFILLFIIWGIGGNDGSKSSLMLYELFTIIPAFIYLRYRKYSVRLVFRLRPVSWRMLAVSVLIGLSLTVIGDELDRMMQMILPIPEELRALLTTALTADSFMDWVYLILAAVLLAAFLEEMLFRGFLQNALEEKIDVTRAVLAAAFIFSIIHINPYWMVQIVILGVVLGVMAWKSDSIFPGATVHLVNNGLALIFLNNREADLGIYYWNGHVNPAFLLLAGGALYFSMILFYRFADEEVEIPSYLNQPL